MVTICGKKFSNTREKLLLSGVKEKKETEEFFEKLKQRKELSGTAIPNSTYRSISSIEHLNQEKSLDLTSPRTRNEAENDDEPVTVGSKKPSILLGTGTLEELKELKELLHQSSYIPKKPAARRSTIEKIRNAIEKEKQTIKEEEKERSESDESPELSDASTSTTKVKKIKKKVKTRKNSITAQNNVNRQTKNKGGKTKKNSSSSGKIDAQIQCSIKLKR